MTPTECAEEAYKIALDGFHLDRRPEAVAQMAQLFRLAADRAEAEVRRLTAALAEAEQEIEASHKLCGELSEQ